MMNAKTLLIRFAILIGIALAAGPVYAITFNALVFFGAIPQELMDKAYGTTLTMQAAFVWMGAVTAGVISIFIKDDWRYILLFSPVYAPPLFAIIHTLMQ